MILLLHVSSAACLPPVFCVLSSCLSVTSSSGNSTLTTKVPTVEMIENLGMNNVLWTKEQLEQMADETFNETVETLGNVSEYNDDQLGALRKKAIKVQWRLKFWFCSFSFILTFLMYFILNVCILFLMS